VEGSCAALLQQKLRREASGAAGVRSKRSAGASKEVKSKKYGNGGEPHRGGINRVSGEDIVAYGKAGRAAAAIGVLATAILRMPLGMRIPTRDLCAQLTPCGG
jgi:hypothetical protein